MDFKRAALVAGLFLVALIGGGLVTGDNDPQPQYSTPPASRSPATVAELSSRHPRTRGHARVRTALQDHRAGIETRDAMQNARLHRAGVETRLRLACQDGTTWPTTLSRASGNPHRWRSPTPRPPAAWRFTTSARAMPIRPRA